MLHFRPAYLKSFVLLSLQTIYFAIYFRRNALELLLSLSYSLRHCSFLPSCIGRVDDDYRFRCLPDRSPGYVLEPPYFTLRCIGVDSHFSLLQSLNVWYGRQSATESSKNGWCINRLAATNADADFGSFSSVSFKAFT